MTRTYAECPNCSINTYGEILFKCTACGQIFCLDCADPIGKEVFNAQSEEEIDTDRLTYLQVYQNVFGCPGCGKYFSKHEALSPHFEYFPP